MTYRTALSSQMAVARDVPPVSGAIIWARQIERQLGLYMNRVEDVLGKGWELYAEGQKLASESQSFTKKLDTKPIFNAWLEDIQKRDLNIAGKVFEIRLNRSLGNIYQLSVNFDSQIISLFKEVRNMIWLNFQVPHVVTNSAKDAKRVYPYAVSLQETVRTYSQISTVISKWPELSPLVAIYRSNIHEIISKGIQVRWEFFVNSVDIRSDAGTENRHVMFVREFASAVSVYQDKVNNLLAIYEEINAAVEDIKTCTFSKEKFAKVIDKIQRDVDKLNLESYSNLDSWTEKLDTRIELLLTSRLVAGVKVGVVQPIELGG